MRIIAGAWRGRRLRALQGREVRPTADRVREAWMSALGGSLEGLTVLDLFAGSGALGLESLSRGAERVVFVETSPRALRLLSENVRLLGAEERCQVHRSDAFKYAEAQAPSAFDVALADPPYDQGYASRLLTLFQGRPFARALWVEHRTGEEIPAIRGLVQRRYGDTTLSALEAGE